MHLQSHVQDFGCSTKYNNSLIAKWKNILIIDYYHPAARYPNKVNYYSLLIAQEKYNFRILKNKI